MDEDLQGTFPPTTQYFTRSDGDEAWAGKKEAERQKQRRLSTNKRGRWRRDVLGMGRMQLDWKERKIKGGD